MPSYLITDASRGLGYGWVEYLAADPSNTVIAIVRNKPATEARLAKDNIKNVHVFAADVVDHAALATAAADTAKVTSGKLDFLVHNAALISDQSRYITALGDTPEGLEEDLVSSFRSNVVGTANVVSAFLPLIRAGKEKKVIVTSSGMADLDFVNQFGIAIATAYAVSKAAANMLVSKYHAALGKSEGILVFSMSPGLVDTREGKPLSEEEAAGFKAMGEQFKDYAPHFKGPLTTKESVEAQLKVINYATVETFGGSFVSHFGDKQWL